MRDASNLAERLKWKWSGHVARTHRWTHKLTMWDPSEGRRTWDDNGRDGLTNSKDLRATNGPEVRKTEYCGKNLKKL